MEDASPGNSFPTMLCSITNYPFNVHKMMQNVITVVSVKSGWDWMPQPRVDSLALFMVHLMFNDRTGQVFWRWIPQTGHARRKNSLLGR